MQFFSLFFVLFLLLLRAKFDTQQRHFVLIGKKREKRKKQYKLNKKMHTEFVREIYHTSEELASFRRTERTWKIIILYI